MQIYPPYIITNIVAVGSFTIADKINLNNIQQNDGLKSAYNAKKFPAIIIKTVNPKSTTLLFASGKYVLTGLKNFDDILYTIEKLKALLEFNKIRVTSYEYKIQNIVTVGTVGKNIDLNEANIKLSNAIYEPDVFPGMVMYHTCEPHYKRASFLIFGTGKAVCAGLNDTKLIEIAFENIQKEIEDKSLNRESSQSNFDQISIESLLSL